MYNVIAFLHPYITLVATICNMQHLDRLRFILEGLQSAYPNVPHTGAVEEKGVSLSNLSDVGQVPDVETVVVVHHCYLNAM